MIKVKQQYSDYPYPEPIAPDQLETIMVIGDPCRDEHFFSYFPDQSRRPLKILSAGCGTFQAALLAKNNPDCQVVGIDFSETSIRCSDELRSYFQLDNLTLHVEDLLNPIGSFKDFDLIFCTGVLHHLNDPLEGLISLKNMLNSDGAINLMMYGKGLRNGIYQIQEALRRLKIKQNTEGIRLTRELLRLLADDHPVQRYVAMAKGKDLASDAGLVDTFLHPTDQAYWLDELIQLVEASGLNVFGFLDNCEYHDFYSNGRLSQLRQQLPRLMEMQFVERAIIMDRLSAHKGRHMLIVKKHSFMHANDFLKKGFKPFLKQSLVRYQQDSGTSIERERKRIAKIKENIVPLLKLVDGTRDLDALIQAAKPDLPKMSEIAIKTFLIELWERGFVAFRS